MTEKMQFVITASRNLYPWVPAVIHSLLEHNPNSKLWFFAEDERLPYELPEQVEVVDVSKQTIFNSENCANWRTWYTYMSLMRSTYALLFTGKQNGCGIRTLPKLDKIVQLDVDLIVRENLQPLWDVDMDGKWFFMTDEVLGNYKPFGKNEPHYFNCGVCVFNLEQMRKDGIVMEGIEWLKENEIRCIDQDLWNWILKKYGYDKCLIMGSRYNETFVTGQSLRPAIIHYCGERNWYKDFDLLYRGAYMEEYSVYFEREACRAAGIEC